MNPENQTQPGMPNPQAGSSPILANGPSQDASMTPDPVAPAIQQNPFTRGNSFNRPSSQQSQSLTFQPVPAAAQHREKAPMSLLKRIVLILIGSAILIIAISVGYITVRNSRNISNDEAQNLFMNGEDAADYIEDVFSHIKDGDMDIDSLFFQIDKNEFEMKMEQLNVLNTKLSSTGTKRILGSALDEYSNAVAAINYRTARYDEAMKIYRAMYSIIVEGYNGDLDISNTSLTSGDAENIMSHAGLQVSELRNRNFLQDNQIVYRAFSQILSQIDYDSDGYLLDIIYSTRIALGGNDA